MNAVVSPSNNPFRPADDSGTVQPSSGVLSEVGQQREIAEVQAAMVIAKKYPRDPMLAMDRIMQACTRPTLAEGALYSYSRGGQDITGPSIRLAEVAAQAWGNLQFGIRELEQRHGESTVEAFAWDIETNTRQVKVFQVKHVRDTKRGRYKIEDGRDIYELVANQGARRLRACILGVIPGDVIEAAVRQCEETMHASADTSADGIKKLVAAFAKIGVTQAQIEKRIQSRIEAIRPAQVVQLRKVHSSIKDGMSVSADWFEAEAGAAVAEAPKSLADKVKAAGRTQVAAKPKAKVEAPLPSITEKEALQMLREAGDADTLGEAWSDIVNRYAAQGEPIPIKVEAARNDRREALAQEAGRETTGQVRA